ncbi:MAG: hypothetical protein IJN31_02325 [Peptococcaceae bacterium]|nr:hypothetical protein [Peptococcaceae bacterium]
MTKALTLNSGNYTIAVRTISIMLCCIMCMSLFMLAGTNVAYCEGTATEPKDAIDSIVDAFGSFTTKLYTLMRQIAAPISALCFGFAGVMFIIGGKNGPEKARVLIIGGIVGVVLIIAAPLIAREVAGMGVGIGAGDLNNYNPLLGE